MEVIVDPVEVGYLLDFVQLVLVWLLICFHWIFPQDLGHIVQFSSFNFSIWNEF